MEIYVTHSRSFDFKNELYLPIKNSSLNREHKFIFPHEVSDEPFDSKPLIMSGRLGLLIAETSYKSTGQGVEIGWADSVNIPIALLYKSGLQPSNSLSRVSNLWIGYSSDSELIKGIERIITTLSKK